MVDPADVEKAISEVARACTGLRAALRSVGLDDEVEAAYQLESDAMDQLEALRSAADQAGREPAARQDSATIQHDFYPLERDE
jgi:chemotaxis regulatin CheY-phosphate phosphatase CheZ